MPRCESLALQIAHYYCELAEQAVGNKDYTAARAFVKKAQSGRPRTQRGALTRARIAMDTDDHKTAVRLQVRAQALVELRDRLFALVYVHQCRQRLGNQDIDELSDA